LDSPRTWKQQQQQQQRQQQQRVSEPKWQAKVNSSSLYALALDSPQTWWPPPQQQAAIGQQGWQATRPHAASSSPCGA
jgi:hypothetical protein